MSKLLFSTTMSLDGFTAGAGGDMSWLTEHLGSVGSDLDYDALVAGIGALLIGKRTYGGDDPNKGTDREGPFGGRWHGPSFVLTHDPPPEPTDPDTTFVGDLETAVKAARDAAGDKYVHVLGANVAAQCIEAGELDEVLVFIAPVLLGDGVRLFEYPGGTNVRLELLDPEQVGRTTLWYRVVR